MTDHYVYSGAAGSGTGADWANAFTTLSGAMSGAAAGDRFFVAHDHAESVAGSNITISTPGTFASPVQILCVDRGGSVPPTSADLTTGATITTTGAGSIFIDGVLYCYGIEFRAGSGNVNATIGMQNAAAHSTQVYEQCNFILGTTAASGQFIQFGSTQFFQRRFVWINCNAKFGGTGSQRIAVGQGFFEWYGGSILSGSTTPDAVFRNSRTAPASGHIKVVGVDFSNLSSSANFFDGGGMDGGELRNCKLPASWSGSLINGTKDAPQGYWRMVNCDSGDTNYKFWQEEYAGDVRDETTIVRSGGASDGSTSLSWKMAAAANAEYPTIYLASPEIYGWIGSTGSKTFTVEIVNDGSTLKDDEVWLEIEYLGTSGFPLGLIATDKANVLATAADQTSSSETWTTTGLSSPVKQSLAVTATVNEVGPFVARVILAKASQTIYVDPLVTVS